MFQPRVEKEIRRLRRRIYSGNVKKYINKIGIDELATPIYKLAVKSIEGDYREYEIEGNTASFYNTEHIPHKPPERHVLKDIIKNINKSDVFYDLGANRGLYTCFVGNSISEGTVYSFEPNYDARNDLRRNIELNNLSKVVNISGEAIGGSVGTKQFVIADETTNHRITDQESVEEANTVDVKTTTLQHLIEKEKKSCPTLIKMDIEGAEVSALRNVGDTLEQCRLLYCEVHSSAKGETVLSELRSLGFDNIEEIHTRSDNNYMLKAGKRG